MQALVRMAKGAGYVVALLAVPLILESLVPAALALFSGFFTWGPEGSPPYAVGAVLGTVPSVSVAFGLYLLKSATRWWYGWFVSCVGISVFQKTLHDFAAGPEKGQVQWYSLIAAAVALVAGIEAMVDGRAQQRGFAQGAHRARLAGGQLNHLFSRAPPMGVASHPGARAAE